MPDVVVLASRDVPPAFPLTASSTADKKRMRIGLLVAFFSRINKVNQR